MAKAREEVTRLPFINSETLEKKKWNDRIVPIRPSRHTSYAKDVKEIVKQIRAIADRLSQTIEGYQVEEKKHGDKK